MTEETQKACFAVVFLLVGIFVFCLWLRSQFVAMGNCLNGGYYDTSYDTSIEVEDDDLYESGSSYDEPTTANERLKREQDKGNYGGYMPWEGEKWEKDMNDLARAAKYFNKK